MPHPPRRGRNRRKPQLAQAVADSPELRARARLSRDLGIPYRRLLGWEPRTYSRTHPDGLTVTTRDPEWSPDDLALLDTLAEWEADRCPCGCGQALSECLIDATVPPEDRPRWGAGFVECGAGLHLAQAQAKQAEADEKAAKHTKRPVVTTHRIWQVGRRPDTTD